MSDQEPDILESIKNHQQHVPPSCRARTGNILLRKAADEIERLRRESQKESKGRKPVRHGDLIELRNYGKVIFKGFDYYMGQCTAKIYSPIYRETFHPFVHLVEAEGYELLNI